MPGVREIQTLRFAGCLLAIAVGLGACGGESGEKPKPSPYVLTDATSADSEEPTPDVTEDTGPPPCTKHGDCPEGRCHPVTHACVPCLVATDCPTQPATCVVNACQPVVGCAGDEACAETGQVCDVASGKCVACLENAHCGDGLECKARTCVPPSLSCSTSKDCPAPYVCAKKTSSCVECLVSADCGTKGWCDAGVCKPPVCSPGSLSCLSPKSAGVCKTDGSGYSPLTCPAGNTCIDGKCFAPVCAAGTKGCVEGKVAECDASGLKWLEAKACDEGKVCKDGACIVQMCTAGQTQCDGAALLQCDTKGAWLKIGECPPDAEGKPQICVLTGGAAQCQTVMCPPGEKTCNGLLVMQCNATGTAVDAVASCTDAQVCDGGACLAKKCTPGATACASETSLAKCNELGTAWLKLPCAEDQACDNDACAAKVCTPGEKLCVGLAVHLCNAVGTGSSLVSDCATDDKICMAGTCQASKCSPGEKICISGQVATCQADGKSWGTAACPGGQTCMSGVCSVGVCVPGAKACQSGKVVQCNADGSANTPIEDCAAQGKGCQAGQCVAFACQPGSTLCQGDQLATCKGNGSGYTTSSCDDGDFCTQGDTCLFAKCVPGNDKPATCNDQNECTADGCSSGACTHTNVSDGTSCQGGGDGCSMLGCQAGACKVVGSKLFSLSFPSPAPSTSAYATAVAQGPTGYLVGGALTTGPGWLIRVGTGGNVLWQQTLSGGATVSDLTLAGGKWIALGDKLRAYQDPGVVAWVGPAIAGGRLAAVGSTILVARPVGNPAQIQLQRFDADNGNLLAATELTTGPDTHSAVAVVPATDDSVRVVGLKTNSSGAALLVLATTPNGAVKWTASQGKILSPKGFALPGGDLLVLGQVPGATTTKVRAVRWTAAGKVAWDVELSAPDGAAFSVPLAWPAGEGRVWLLARKGPASASETIAHLLDKTGAVVVKKPMLLFDPVAQPALSVSQPTPEGGFVAAGTVLPGGGNKAAPWLVRADAWGHITCSPCLIKAQQACEDGNPCTLDGCDNGTCTHDPAPEETPCGQGVMCIKGFCT